MLARLDGGGSLITGGVPQLKEDFPAVKGIQDREPEK
ncbi:hypothetical protein ES707_20929 [subsurface metagenome]